MFKFNLFLVVSIVIAILVGVKYGIVGVAIAVTLATSIGNLIFLKVVLADLKIKVSEIYQVIKASFWSCLFMALGVYVVRSWLLQQSLAIYQVLIVSILTGMIVFIASLYVLFKADFSWLWGLLANTIMKKKSQAVAEASS